MNAPPTDLWDAKAWLAFFRERSASYAGIRSAELPPRLEDNQKAMADVVVASTKLYASYLVDAQRRERIATAAMQGLLTFGATAGIGSDFAKGAVELADALIAELDKKGAAR